MEQAEKGWSDKHEGVRRLLVDVLRRTTGVELKGAGSRELLYRYADMKVFTIRCAGDGALLCNSRASILKDL